METENDQMAYMHPHYMHMYMCIYIYKHIDDTET